MFLIKFLNFMAVAILLIFLEEEIKFQHWKRDDKKEDKVRSKAIKKGRVLHRFVTYISIMIVPGLLKGLDEAQIMRKSFFLWEAFEKTTAP